MGFAYAYNSQARQALLEKTLSMRVGGRICGISGLILTIDAFVAPVGAQCEIRTRSGATVPAEVIGFREGRALAIALSDAGGVAAGDPVQSISAQARVPVGDNLLGRVLNGQGRPMDRRGPLLCGVQTGIVGNRLEALSRSRINTPLATGVRSIDTLLTCGQGQRMGIFSGAGVGKSVLLGTIARHTSAEVVVIALVGERGREVREFIEKDLGPEGLARSVLIVSTSDEAPPLRVRAAFLAATIAESFRDQGKNVLFLMDSVTRVAMAQRQIGLALGEPPATKGYTPSVFALLPTLVERCGNSEAGSMTGFFTVLVEGDDPGEPIADTMRGLLDGHIWLSRELAARNHYPAVDVTQSISRVMVDVTDAEHQQMARDITRLAALYKDIEDLVTIGAYATGSNPEYDLAVTAQDAINQFLQQPMHEGATYEQSRRQLHELVASIRQQIAGRQGTPASEPAATKEPTKPLGLERMMAGLDQ